MTIEQVWKAVEEGKTVTFKDNSSYKVYVEPAQREYHLNHFTFKNDKVLSIRCISNYFGSIMDEKELKDLKIEE